MWFYTFSISGVLSPYMFVSLGGLFDHLSATHKLSFKRFASAKADLKRSRSHDFSARRTLEPYVRPSKIKIVKFRLLKD